MKTIQSFTASGVFGYLKMDLAFNEKVTFLYGLNGSGKTTALKLIMALLEPSLKPLIKIPFNMLELQGISHENKRFSIGATKNKQGELRITCSIFPNTTYSCKVDDVDDEEIQLLEREARLHPVISSILSVGTPIFLGIDRRFRTPDYQPIRRRYISQRDMAFEFRRERNLEDSSFDAGLGEVAMVIDEFVKNLRHRKFEIDNDFRKQILLDSFAYIDAGNTKFGRTLTNKEFEDFSGKRDAIMQTLKSLELASEALEQRSKNFFEKIEGVFSIINNLRKSQKPSDDSELSQALTSWFINQSQVDRINSLFELANQYQMKQERLLRPLNAFVNLINRFFKQTGKEVIIDNACDVKIKINDKVSSLQTLSSGERQMFIMLAHLSLNRRLSKDGIFIVDEPELSLHMDWQDMFVEALEAANPKLQIILATHAPAIIGGRDSLCIPVSYVEED